MKLVPTLEAMCGRFGGLNVLDGAAVGLSKEARPLPRLSFASEIRRVYLPTLIPM